VGSVPPCTTNERYYETTDSEMSLQMLVRFFWTAAILGCMVIIGSMYNANRDAEKKQALAMQAQASSELQECIDQGYQLIDKPLPFSGYFCTKPALFSCDSLYIAALMTVADQYEDKSTHFMPDVWTNSLADALKYGEEYLAHPECTKDVRWVRQNVDYLHKLRDKNARK
jgi:hypothetical protein